MKQEQLPMREQKEVFNRKEFRGLTFWTFIHAIGLQPMELHFK